MRRQLSLLAFLTTALTCVLLATTSHAQKNSLEEGIWALQFEVNGDFDLRSFQGTTFSLKKHTSNRAAWRVGVSLDVDLEDRDDTDKRNDTTHTLTEWDDDSQSISLTVQKVLYPNPTGTVSFYYGFGPIASFFHFKDKRKINDRLMNRSDERTWSRTGWAVGVTGLLGVEWFPSTKISLLAEYGTVIDYSHSKVEREQVWRVPGSETVTELESKTKGFSLAASHVRFGLSVYF